MGYVLVVIIVTSAAIYLIILLPFKCIDNKNPDYPNSFIDVLMEVL